MSDLANMQPIEAFVKHYVSGKCKWRADREYVIYNHPHRRFRITVESPDMSTVSEGFIGVWRDEKLMDAGINVGCEDAKEFAQSLLKTLFYHLSPHETMHIVAALERDLEEWHAERSAAYPELAGDDKRCPY